METWLRVPDWRSYEVSDGGNVRSVDRVLADGRHCGGVTLTAKPDAHGYPRVTLRDGNRRKTVKVHVLVMAAFTGPCPEGQQVRHWNDNPLDNTLGNLVYGTPKDNAEDKKRNRENRGIEQAKEQAEETDEAGASWESAVPPHGQATPGKRAGQKRGPDLGFGATPGVATPEGRAA